MARFLDPKADLTFKKVFGEHKNLVMSLLNALLPLEEGKQVESIEYLQPELPPRTPLSKDSIVDVRCRETGGRQFIVEMQMNWRSNYEQRALFNAAKAYAGQLSPSEEFHLLQPVYSLNLVNDTFEPDRTEYYHYYHLVHDRDCKKVLDGLHLIFVELPKFRPGNLAEKKMQVLWLRFLTEINEKTKCAPQELLDDPHVNEALELVEESALSTAEIYEYDMFWDRVRREATAEGNMRRTTAALQAAKAELEAVQTERDAATARADAATARADAATAERDAATAERDAVVEKLHQTVRQMKADGMAAETIAKYTGMTVADVARIC